jgi:hypothetical protein
VAKPTDNLSIAAASWAKTHAALAPHLNPEQNAKVVAVMRQDMARVMQGHAPMPQPEITASVAAALGVQTVKPPTPKSGVGEVIGNIGRDLGGIVRNLNPPTLARNIIREGEAAGNFDWSHLASGGGGFESVPQGFRDLAKAPILRMIPGVSTIAAATTAEGRKSLTEHPVGAALDILPLAGAVSKLAGVVGAEGSVTESLQAGKPLQASLRATGAAATKLAPETAARISESTAAVLRAARIDPMSRTLQRAKSEADLTAHAQVEDVIKKHIAPFLEHQMTDEEKALLYDEITNPAKHPNPTPEHQTLIAKARELSSAQAKLAVDRGELHPITIGDRTEYYSLNGAEGKVVEGMKSLETHQTRLNARLRDLTKREKFVAAYVKRKEAQVAASEARVQKYATANAGVGGRFRQAQVALDADRAALEKAKADPYLPKLRQRVAEQTARVAHLNDQVIKDFISTAPARYHPMLEGELRARTIARANAMYAGSPALEAALMKLKLGDVSDIWSKEEWAATKADVQTGWTRLVAAGYDPIHIHTVTETTMGGVLYGRPLAQRYTTPDVVKERVFDLRPRLHDAAMGLTASAVEFIRASGTEKMIIDHVLPLAKTNDEVMRDLAPFIHRAEAAGPRAISSLAGSVEKIRADRWVKFDPQALWNFSTPRLRAIADESEVFLPKHIADQVAEMSKPPSTNALRQGYNRTTAIFKVSVLTGPRHLAHVTLGGVMFMLGRGHVDDYLHWRDAWQLAKDPTLMPSALSHGLDVMTTDQIFSEAAGNKIGTIFAKVLTPAKAMARAEETVANMQRAMAYLGGKGRALRHGLSADMAEEIGIRHANKMFMDFNGYTSFERGVLKQVFPFYSFTRHILGYVLTYPIDHPMRAAILSNIAEINAKDNASGLPETFQNLFYLGPMDKNGNVNAIDLRTFNPMRDVGNMFSLRGFFTSLNPVAQAVLQAGGVNPLTGSPQLYAQMDFDPVTGSMVSRRPSDIPLKTLESIVPPVSALDNFLGLSANVRAMKASSPLAARKAVFSALNIPFVPQQYNLPQTKAKIEQRLYADALSKMTAATTTGDFTDVLRYNLAPTPAKFGGGLQKPADVKQRYDAVAEALKKSGSPAKPKAVLPVPKKKKKAALPKKPAAS